MAALAAVGRPNFPALMAFVRSCGLIDWFVFGGLLWLDPGSCVLDCLLMAYV